MNNVIFKVATVLVSTCLLVMALSNGALGKILGSPYIATLCSFLIATLLVGKFVSFAHTPIRLAAQMSKTSSFMWVGGVIIAMNILTIYHRASSNRCRKNDHFLYCWPDNFFCNY